MCVIGTLHQRISHLPGDEVMDDANKTLYDTTCQLFDEILQDQGHVTRSVSTVRTRNA